MAPHGECRMVHFCAPPRLRPNLTDNVPWSFPMAARPTWKGYLKISLVNIPVRVFPATDAAATISFNQLHNVCRSRIQQKKWCPTCQIEVAQTDLVKGYEFEKGKY